MSKRIVFDAPDDVVLQMERNSVYLDQAGNVRWTWSGELVGASTWRVEGVR